MKKIYERYLQIRKKSKKDDKESYKMSKKYLNYFMKHIQKIMFLNENSDYINTESYKLIVEKMEKNKKEYDISLTVSIYDTKIIDGDKKIKIYETVIFKKEKFIDWLNQFIGYNYYKTPIKMKFEDTGWEFIDKKEEGDEINFIHPKLNYFIKNKSKKIITNMIVNMYTFINSITKNLQNIHNIEYVPYNKDILTLQMRDFDIITNKEGEIFFNVSSGKFIYEDVDSDTEYDNIKDSFFKNKTKKRKQQKQETILDFFKRLSIDKKKKNNDKKQNNNDITESLLDNEIKDDYEDDSDYFSDTSSDDYDTSSSEDVSELYKKTNICIKKRNKYYLY